MWEGKSLLNFREDQISPSENVKKRKRECCHLNAESMTMLGKGNLKEVRREGKRWRKWTKIRSICWASPGRRKAERKIRKQFKIPFQKSQSAKEGRLLQGDEPDLIIRSFGRNSGAHLYGIEDRPIHVQTSLSQPLRGMSQQLLWVNQDKFSKTWQQRKGWVGCPRLLNMTVRNSQTNKQTLILQKAETNFWFFNKLCCCISQEHFRHHIGSEFGGDLVRSESWAKESRIFGFVREPIILANYRLSWILTSLRCYLTDLFNGWNRLIRRRNGPVSNTGQSSKQSYRVDPTSADLDQSCHFHYKCLRSN